MFKMLKQNERNAKT